MNDSVHHCIDGGYLVDARGWLPPEPFDFYFGGTPAFGCNALVCTGCNRPVRTLPDAQTVRMDLRPPEGLYEAPDWRPFTCLRTRTTAPTRLYLCRCAWFESHGVTPLGGPPGMSLVHSFPPAWRCAGHPPLGLPHRLDQVELGEDTDFGCLAAQLLTGQLTPQVTCGQPADVAFWLTRLYHLLWAHPRLARTLALGIAEQGGSEDVKVRRHVLRFFQLAADAPGSTELLRLARTRGSLFADVKSPVPGDARPFLDELLVAFLGRVLTLCPPADERYGESLALLRTLVETPRKAKPAIHHLFRHDPHWVVTHAEAIVRATPAALGALLNLILESPLRGQAVAVARRLVHLDEVEEGAFRRVARDLFYDAPQDLAALLADLAHRSPS